MPGHTNNIGHFVLIGKQVSPAAALFFNLAHRLREIFRQADRLGVWVPAVKLYAAEAA